MGTPFKPFIVERMVGYCDSCGLGSKSWGVQSGRATTICDNCATGIAAAVSKKNKRIPSDGKLRVQAVA